MSDLPQTAIDPQKRLEELFEKSRKSPKQMSIEEVQELIRLHKQEKATVGQRVARETRQSKSGRVKGMDPDEMLKKLEELASLKQSAATQ